MLAGLSGWLGSRPSAQALLDEIIRALEEAQAKADEPAEKARLKSIRDGLLGAANKIAINVISDYLKHVNVPHL